MQAPKPPKLIQGNIGKTILTLTFHMFWGMVAMVTFNLVDTYFVSRLGTTQLAAMTFTFPIVMILNGIALGIGTGASAIISVTLGKKAHKEAKRLTTDSLSLGFIIVVIFIIFGYLSIEPLFKMMGARGEILVYVKKYMYIWYAGVPFVVFPMIGNMAIRATGDMKTPSFIMIMAVLINAIFDPLLIFGLGFFPKLGLQGAALSTVFARLTSFSISLYILIHRDKLITFKRVNISRILKSWGKILYIGIPIAILRLILPLGMGIITRILANFGKSVVAGFGVASRIEFFVFTVIVTLSSVMSPFIGQNLGAKKIDRIKKGLIFSNNLSLLYGFLIFLLFQLFGLPIAKIFNHNHEVYETISLYLKIVPLSYGLYGITMIGNAFLNVIRKPYQGAMIIGAQVFILYIPLAIISSRMFGVKGVFYAGFLAYFITGIISLLVEKVNVNKVVNYYKLKGMG